MRSLLHGGGERGAGIWSLMQGEKENVGAGGPDASYGRGV